MFDRLRFLLLQMRDGNDPMRMQEVRCFARALCCRPDQIEVCDLLAGVPGDEMLSRADVVLLGGSGDYSVAEGGDWLPIALEGMRKLVREAKPTFASCWGFQAMAQALGGEVAADLSRAELGTISLDLTAAGRADPVFGSLSPQFLGLAGHQDVVTRLPAEAVLLASSALVANQAFRIAGKPIYCTQFHPELDREALLQRVRAYPQYVVRIAGMTAEELGSRCVDTPEAEAILRRFVRQVFA